eukprot:COSAG06_NODE_54087_length_296_cov_1.050761_1_plen_21_part_10
MPAACLETVAPFGTSLDLPTA